VEKECVDAGPGQQDPYDFQEQEMGTEEKDQTQPKDFPLIVSL
jgi:hypothetical protein